MKLAMLVLARNGIDTSLRVGEDFNEFIIKDLEKDVVEDARNLFLHFTDSRVMFEDKSGRQILQIFGKRSVFIQGLKQNIGEDEQVFSYNFPKNLISLSRDRHLSNSYDICVEITKLLLNLKDENLMETVLESMLDDEEYFDIKPDKLAVYSGWNNVHAWKVFIRKKYENYAICQNENQAYVTTSLGKKALIIVDSNVAKFLVCMGMKTFKETVPDFYDIDVEDLPEDDEKLSEMLSLIHKVIPETLPYDYEYFLFTVKENSEKDRHGAFVKSRSIYIKKSSWESDTFSYLIGNLTHELSHIFGPDLDQNFEGALTMYLGKTLDYIRKKED